MNAFPKVVLRTILSGSILFGGWGIASAQSPGARDSSPAADNTAVNQRDRNIAQPTADQQTNDRSDREITRKIRQAVTKDKSLSTYAHNIKIITQSGMVTLKGPVRSEEEKKVIEAKATEIAGESNVTSNLDVKRNN